MADVVCGTVASYGKRGCRCDLCRAAVAEYARDYRTKVVARDGLSPTQKARPRQTARLCVECGEPLLLALSQALRHMGCGLTSFHVPLSVRAAAYERDNAVCQLCGEPVDLTLRRQDSNMAPTLDHVIPRSLGGGNEPSNLQLAHLACNSSKGNRHGVGATVALGDSPRG